MGEKRVRMLIYGRVQGVCYRAYTCEEAKRLSLKGTVRNLPDGRVEILAEGPAEDVLRLEAFCRTGPPFAQVRRVEVREEPSTSGHPLTSFRISH
jgi:acylphosphatase